MKNTDKLAGILALIALLIAGIVGVVGFILNLFDASFNAGIFNMIKDFCMVTALAIIAWKALKGINLPGPNLLWTIILIIAIVMSYCGVFGININF